MAKENKDMEKKITSSPARLTSCETKGKENGRSNGAKPQRFNKNRREPPQGRTQGDPNSQSRRPAPQKSRALDKRPRSRGLPASRRDEVTVTQRAEFGSALPYGPKKLNLNHLLNFTFAPREAEDARGGSGWRGRSRLGHRRFNKEQFLQANCQFVVKAQGDYTQQSVDPDSLVEWDLIEQIRMLGHEMPSCPICLYPPTAAKITKCGHIYCWPCILHYISLGEKKWRKCPICYESVMADDLKSVVAKSLKTFSAGDTITMRLMKREKGSITVHPHYPESDPTEMSTSPCMTDSPEETCFAKLMIASPSEVKDEILQRERGELEKQLKEAIDDFEKSFIQRAMDSLKEREDGLSLGAAVIETSSTDDKRPSLDQSRDENDMTMMSTPILPKEDCVVYTSAFSDEELDEETLEKTSSTPDDEQLLPTSTSQEPSNTERAAPSQSTKEPRENGDSSDDVLEENNVSDDADNPSVQQDTGVPVSEKTGEEEENKQEIDRGEKKQELDGEEMKQGQDGGEKKQGQDGGEKKQGQDGGEKKQGQDGGEEKEKEGVDRVEMSPRQGAGGRERKTSSNQGSNIFFYQAEDGQHMYLGSLNARCLMHEYSHLEHSPLTITAKIIEIEHVSITQEMRNRMRHLQHLPLTCEVCVCELALRPPIISPKTLSYFSAEIQKKKQKRDKKAREEKRRERKINQEEDRKNGIYPKPKYSLKSTNQFPSFSPGSGPDNPGPPRPISPASVDSAASSNYSAVLSDHHDDDLMLGTPHIDNEITSFPADVAMSPPGGAAGGAGGGGGGWPSLSSPDNQGGHRSFAQMLRDGTGKPSSPMRSSHQQSGSPQHYTASYGRTPGRELTSSNDSDNEDYVPVPQYKDAFSNAIQDALDKAALMSIKKSDDADGDTGKGGGGGGGRKNKKGRKKQLLFSTAGPRFK